ncbi:hypothetical protein ACH4ND_25915 [Streptomyces sp. NPDC017179]|uniref:hypothetical protein n=1 Tax=Streptomyces sp. NPDC017179 TaxID=3364979 RepID=UPI0037B6A74B
MWFIALRDDLTARSWQAARADARAGLTLPEVDVRAVRGLKFAEALPGRLAEATLAVRLADEPGGRRCWRHGGAGGAGGGRGVRDVRFRPTGWEDLLYWQFADRKLFRNVVRLIGEIQHAPHRHSGRDQRPPDCLQVDQPAVAPAVARC